MKCSNARFACVRLVGWRGRTERSAENVYLQTGRHRRTARRKPQ